MENNYHSQLFCIFGETINYIGKFLIDFEKVFENEKIKEELPLAREAYMEAIIVNLGKIFNATENDKFGITQLKNIARKREKEDLENIEKEHKNIISKVNNNRNKKFAHTDKEHYKLCRSESEIRVLKKSIMDNSMKDEKEVNQRLSKIPRATHKGEERYTINDLNEDLLEIKYILCKLDKILLNISMSYYK